MQHFSRKGQLNNLMIKSYLKLKKSIHIVNLSKLPNVLTEEHVAKEKISEIAKKRKEV